MARDTSTSTGAELLPQNPPHGTNCTSVRTPPALFLAAHAARYFRAAYSEQFLTCAPCLTRPRDRLERAAEVPEPALPARTPALLFAIEARSALYPLPVMNRLAVTVFACTATIIRNEPMRRCVPDHTQRVSYAVLYCFHSVAILFLRSFFVAKPSPLGFRTLVFTSDGPLQIHRFSAS